MTSVERRTRPPLEPPRGEDCSWLEGDGGVRLFVSIHRPDAAWGVVDFVLGAEIGTGEPYPRFVEALRAAGLATLALHPRGCGFSDGLRGDLPDRRALLADHRLALDHARRTLPGLPVFLFGHSAGGAYALHVAAHAHAELAGLILVNPAYRWNTAEGLGPTLRDYVTFAFDAVFRRSALTVDMNRDPGAVRHRADREEALAMQRDPLVVRHFSLRAMLAQRAVMNACAKNAASVDAPVLLVQGAEDALIDPRGHDAILAAVRGADKTRLVAPTGGHGASAVETMVDELVAWLARHRG